MLTPRFNLTQTESTVTITVRAPYSNLRELEITIDENTFIFYSSPYYLRLELPGRLLDDDCSKGSFDADSGEFTFNIRKANEGEHFPNLDLITKLLAPKIQVSHPEDQSRKIIIDTNEEVAEKNPEELNEEFGFALSGKQGFCHVASEFRDVFEVDPREIKLDERHKMRVQYEQGKFNIDHYLSDYIENEEIVEIVSLRPPWSELKKDEIQFTDSELDFLKDLNNKHYNLSKTQTNYCFCSLVDILYAYCYDKRTTHFDETSESGWTITKIAASLCWLDVFKTPKDALISAFRRSVIYPLYRNFELCEKILEDLKTVLQLGEKYIIKCLIEMHSIFTKGDCCRYILNELFIKDYIIYIMKWDQSQWQAIVSQVETVVIKKTDLGLNLQELEDDVCQRLSNLRLTTLETNNDDSDDTEYDTASSTEDTSSDSDTTT